MAPQRGGGGAARCHGNRRRAAGKSVEVGLAGPAFCPPGMFGDASTGVLDVESVWRRDQGTRCEEKSTQTLPVPTAERVAQTRHSHEVGSQAALRPARPRPCPSRRPLVDYAGLRAFLQRVEEPVIRELDKNWKSHAFDGFEVNWADPNETALLQVSPTRQGATCRCISQATGAVLACSYGRLDDGDWSSEKSFLCTWNLDRRALNPHRPDLVVEVPSAVLCVAFHPQQPSLIAGNGEVLIWDTSRQEDPLIWRTGMTDDTHTDPVYQVSWHRDPRQPRAFRVLSISTDGKILVWQEERDGLLRPASGFAFVQQQIPRSTKLKKVSGREGP
ncbi:putative WD repeat-containing protein [Naja naja]|nr:putative WD repeat-containing protein [Naja naja]